MTQPLSTQIATSHSDAPGLPRRTAAVRIVHFDRMGRPKTDKTLPVEDILNAPPLMTWRRDGVVAAIAIAVSPHGSEDAMV